MHVCIRCASSQDEPLGGNDLCATSDDHAGRDAVHDVWISCFANPHDHALLDADVGFNDTPPVYDERVDDDHI
jgi:hypothetical protein